MHVFTSSRSFVCSNGSQVSAAYCMLRDCGAAYKLIGGLMMFSYYMTSDLAQPLSLLAVEFSYHDKSIKSESIHVKQNKLLMFPSQIMKNTDTVSYNYNFWEAEAKRPPQKIQNITRFKEKKEKP